VGAHYVEGAPYPGAKPHMQIPEDLLDNRHWLSELVRLTADALPVPKPKSKKTKKRMVIKILTKTNRQKILYQKRKDYKKL
jgi:hypothetical protein